jgi:hypothetical protein
MLCIHADYCVFIWWVVLLQIQSYLNSIWKFLWKNFKNKKKEKISPLLARPSFAQPAPPFSSAQA